MLYPSNGLIVLPNFQLLFLICVPFLLIIAYRSIWLSVSLIIISIFSITENPSDLFIYIWSIINLLSPFVFYWGIVLITLALYRLIKEDIITMNLPLNNAD